MINEILAAIENRSALDIIRYVDEKFGDQVVFSTSFGIEDQVITHLLAETKSKASLFTLDTGRLFPETYSVWNKTISRYKLPIATYYPNTEALQQLLTEKGPLSFYESVENRKECCGIRKVEPLNRALKGFKVWLTGIRAEQSPNREHMLSVEWDEGHQLLKIHPLFHWSLQEVELFLKENNVPYNALHNKGFPSIGCQPCTRAVQPGEDQRAGRWWWEDQSKKECGLHTTRTA